MPTVTVQIPGLADKTFSATYAAQARKRARKYIREQDYSIKSADFIGEGTAHLTISFLPAIVVPQESESAETTALADPAEAITESPQQEQPVSITEPPQSAPRAAARRRTRRSKAEEAPSS